MIGQSTNASTNANNVKLTTLSSITTDIVNTLSSSTSVTLKEPALYANAASISPPVTTAVDAGDVVCSVSIHDENIHIIQLFF